MFFPPQQEPPVLWLAVLVRLHPGAGLQLQFGLTSHDSAQPETDANSVWSGGLRWPNGQHRRRRQRNAGYF